ncbi:MAG: hypothetical protein M1812_000749 [Candelaria pacifica]|nr:MAG: hypothetical protein M1812_000749 [Candelaria pacifica]
MVSLLTEGEVNRSLPPVKKPSRYIPITVKAFLHGVDRTPKVSLRNKRHTCGSAIGSIHPPRFPLKSPSRPDKRLLSSDTPQSLRDKGCDTGNARRDPKSNKRLADPSTHCETERPGLKGSLKATGQPIPALLPNHERSPSLEQERSQDHVKIARIPVHTYSQRTAANRGGNKVEKSRRKRRLPLNELAFLRLQASQSSSLNTNEEPQEPQRYPAPEIDLVDLSQLSSVDGSRGLKIPSKPGAKTTLRNRDTIRTLLAAIRGNMRLRKRLDRLPIDINEFRIPPKTYISTMPRAKRIRVSSGFDNWMVGVGLPPPRYTINRLKPVSRQVKLGGKLALGGRPSNLRTVLPVNSDATQAEVEIGKSIQLGCRNGTGQARSDSSINGAGPRSGRSSDLNTYGDEGLSVTERLRIRELKLNNHSRLGISCMEESDSSQLAKISFPIRPQPLVNLESFGDRGMNSNLRYEHDEVRSQAAQHDLQRSIKRRVTSDEVFQQFARVTAPARPVDNESEDESDCSGNSGLDSYSYSEDSADH